MSSSRTSIFFSFPEHVSESAIDFDTSAAVMRYRYDHHQEISIRVTSHRASVSSPLLNMRRGLLLFALELLVHTSTQQRR
jgi:hypothetical protein